MPELTHQLQIKQTQELRLTQKQIQSLNILQLQKAELEQLVEHELEANPVLERDESPPSDHVNEEELEEKFKNVTETAKIDYEWREEIEKDGYLPSPKYTLDSEDKSFEKYTGHE
ncbi:MAG: hypothetical protein PHQ23_17545, partial [Candidatus Wallbacteria bacterium]|nr:hypothetical protein [Candidatus Wallbacteria bacterium]